jgi:hypothetical protein
MRSTIVIAASVLLLVNSSSRAEDSRACIVKATAALPRLAGLVVKKTRTRPVPESVMATWQGQTRPIMVDVDFVAADGPATYSYICALTKGSAYVRRVMS